MSQAVAEPQTDVDHAERAWSMPLNEINPARRDLFQNDVIWPYFERLRKEAPVHKAYDEDFGEYWSVTRYEDIMAVDTNHHVFSSDWTNGGITLFDAAEDFRLPMFIAMDPPKHDQQRITVQPIVAPNNLKNWEGLIRERTAYVLDSLPRGETFDWVDNVSIELTTMMLATLFDFPFEERRKLTFWSDMVTTDPKTLEGGVEEKRGHLLACLEYFTGLWNERINSDTPGNDLITMLTRGESTKNMDPMEYLGNIILLIVGGNDTTRNSMTASVYGLNKFPGEYDKLIADPSLIPNLSSEIIRWQTPLAHMRRTALEDIELNGTMIKKGDKVAMWYVSGNRDADVFENADDIIIDRPNARRQMSFGYGIHRCVGNRLGELQIKILWEEILKRFPKIELMEEPTRTPGCFVKGYTYMPVRIPA
ncbi:putative cytochrome P450 hydroxylase [Candidatus Phaeomarinobacter ectocarpi]|uniref:Putative cytochrome P450 hydroxylase n=1 Tax=Candidatus Phaeomarinibacter ectocarpi TaxID=1458461 RepID=X5MLD3_9HYPH|nr:cytochrome P450 [Candidatus Phaeomarinobacter ectocarpi]CDO59395.1 putative cytochrome P450 hydroxylase [Candidatus Phaeomarinobacter ectocarpi]